MQDPSKTITRRRFLEMAGVGAGMATLAACGAPAGGGGPAAGTTPLPPGVTPTATIGRAAAPNRKTTINFYSVFGGEEFKGWVKLVEAFEKTQEDIGVKITYSPGHADNPKLLTAIAGGNSPDVATMTPFSTAQWAELGVMTDLTQYVQKDGLTKDEFFPTAWSDMNWKGKVWQVQWDADPNFPLFWNKDLFEKVGLDADTPPKTIEEVDEFSAKINQIKNGKVTQIGMIPWDTYGASNSLFTWGWAFGGEFYDPDKEEVTPDNDNVVKALEWMVGYAKKLGGPDKVAVAPPNLQGPPFATGKIGMAPLVTPNFRDLKKYAPDMKVGTGLLPNGPGVTKPGAAGWLGGWSICIPAGSKNPDAAWEFIKYVSATDEGTKLQWNTVGFPPAYKKAPVLEQIKNDPENKPYYDVLVTAQHSRPTIPVGAFYFTTLDQLVGDAVFGRKTPGQAMKEAKQKTMAEWEKFKKQKG